MASAFLRRTFAPYARTLRVAWLIDVLGVLLFVLQAYVLVGIFGAWFGALVGQSLAFVGLQIGFYGLLALLLGVLLARATLALIKDKLLTDVGLQAAGTLRRALLEKLGVLGLARTDFGADGSLASKAIYEPDALVGYPRFAVQKFTAVVTPVILAVWIGYYHLTAAVLLIITAPIVPLAMALIGIATAKKSRAQMDALAQLGGRFLDWIRGAATLQRLGAMDTAIADIGVSSEAYRVRTMAVLRVAFLNSAVLELISALAIAVVAIHLGTGLLGQRTWGGQVDFATALFILLLVPEFYAPLRRLGAEYHIKGQAMACAKAAAPMLDFRQVHQGGVPFYFAAPPSFELSHVTAFGQDGRVRLSPISLQIPAGKRTAIMGASGSGKSTILQVLLGFGDYQGRIVINDGVSAQDYAALDMALLREQYGYLSQSVPLLPLTIGENLRLAKPDASDDALMAVLTQVGLGDVICQLPQKLATPLGERGQGLSGGQGRRLGIAQLLLQDADVWLLDEPTEHLDPATTQDIYALLWMLSAGKTVLWVTHDEQLLTHERFVFDHIIHLTGAGDEA